MHQKRQWLLAMLVILFCLLGNACAETAQDITALCLYNGGKGSSIRDESYRTVWESSRRNGRHSLVIEAPEGQTIGGILIRWYDQPQALVMEGMNEQGNWQMIGGCEADFLAQFIPVDDQRAVRLTEKTTDGQIRLEISSITVLTPGDVPRDVQTWMEPPGKVELMLLAGHPDDEVLWFGGLLPTYAAAQGREVLVVNASYARNDRRLELLDCLWTCGVRNYPVFLSFPDVCTNQKSRVLQRREWAGAQEAVVALYRRYRPDVVMLHDDNGEYGHGVHRLISEIGRNAAQMAADADLYPSSAGEYGVWDVPKVYQHLYSENQLQMNWDIPLDCFDGLTAYEAALLGFQCHKSQLGEWQMHAGGEYDNSLFGLWRSTVGPDILKEDLFENIVPSR